MTRKSARTIAAALLVAFLGPGTALAQQPAAPGTEYQPYPPPQPPPGQPYGQPPPNYGQPPPGQPYGQPPPNYGQPPQPGAEMPGQPQGQPNLYTPPPPPQRVVLRYEDRHNMGLVIAGASVLGGSYLFFGFMPGAIATASCGNNTGCDTLWPLFIPIAGPFIEIARAGTSYAPLLVLDGLAQASGLALLIAGLATTHKVPVYSERAMVLPFSTAGGAGLRAVGRF
jgi:hypothetical protein